MGRRVDGVEFSDAHIAQLVEHILGKDEVIGSIPIVGSIRSVDGARDANKMVAH